MEELNLFFTSLKALSWLGPQIKGLPLQVSSIMGFNGVCKSGQNKDR